MPTVAQLPRIQATLWLLVVASLVFATVACTGPPALTRDEVLANHLVARGGLERLRSLQSVRMSGTASAGPGRTAHVSREVQLPGRIRTEFDVQGATAVFACDGDDCWSIEPLSGNFEPQPMPDERAENAIQQAQIAGPFVDWEANGYGVELIGVEDLKGRPAYRLHTTMPGGTVRDDLIDGDTWLVVATESTRLMDGRQVDIETVIDDYRDIDGVQFPHSFTMRETGSAEELEVTVESVEVNPALDASHFTFPEVETE